MTPLESRPEVTEVYRSLLGAVAGAGLDEGVQLTSHWPVVGTAPRRLLVVGQAVFGWIPNWSVADLQQPEGPRRILSETQEIFDDADEPMSWIAGNRARSSPFWRTTRKLVESVYPGSSRPWFSHVAWANIYPVARHDIKGNPDGALRTAQLPHAAPLLRAVARSLRPDAVVVLGGGYWWDIANDIRLDGSAQVSRPLLAAGRLDDTPWVAGWHPGGAQRRGFGADRYATIVHQTIEAVAEATR